MTVLTTASYDMSGQSDTQLSKIPEHFVGRDDSPTINVVPSRHEVVRNVDLWTLYPLVNLQETKPTRNYGKSPFLMGKSTISMANFKFANCWHNQRVAPSARSRCNFVSLVLKHLNGRRCGCHPLLTLSGAALHGCLLAKKKLSITNVGLRNQHGTLWLCQNSYWKWP